MACKSWSSVKHVQPSNRMLTTSDFSHVSVRLENPCKEPLGLKFLSTAAGRQRMLLQISHRSNEVKGRKPQKCHDHSGIVTGGGWGGWSF